MWWHGNNFIDCWKIYINNYRIKCHKKVLTNLEMALIDYDGFKCKTIKIPKVLDMILK